MLFVSKSKFFYNTDNYYYKNFYDKKYDNLEFTCNINNDIQKIVISPYKTQNNSTYIIKYYYQYETNYLYKIFNIQQKLMTDSYDFTKNILNILNKFILQY